MSLSCLDHITGVYFDNHDKNTKCIVLQQGGIIQISPTSSSQGVWLVHGKPISSEVYAFDFRVNGKPNPPPESWGPLHVQETM